MAVAPPSSSLMATSPAAQLLAVLSVVAVKAAREPVITRIPTSKNAVS